MTTVRTSPASQASAEAVARTVAVSGRLDELLTATRHRTEPSAGQPAEQAAEAPAGQPAEPPSTTAPTSPSLRLRHVRHRCE